MDVKLLNINGYTDIAMSNRDIVMCSEVENQNYLAHFGGNVEALTSSEVEAGEQHFAYWANPFMPEKTQFNSELEKSLLANELSSRGRVEIQQAAEADLQYLEGFAATSTLVSITGVDRLEILETITDKNNNTHEWSWDKFTRNGTNN